MTLTTRTATPADASSIAALVNQAFEVESSFSDGDRASAAEVRAMMRAFCLGLKLRG